MRDNQALADSTSGFGVIEMTDTASDRLFVHSVGSLRIINYDDIDIILASGNYVEVCHKDGRHLHRATMNYMEKKLCNKKFIRVHRSAIVRISQIVELKSLDDEKIELLLKNGDRVRASLKYKNMLLKAIGVL